MIDCKYMELDTGRGYQKFLSLIPTEQQILQLSADRLLPDLPPFDLKIIKKAMVLKAVDGQPVCLPFVMHAKNLFALINHYIWGEHVIVKQGTRSFQVMFLYMVKARSFTGFNLIRDPIPDLVMRREDKIFLSVMAIRYTQMKMIHAREIPYNVFASDNNYSFPVIKRIQFENISETLCHLEFFSSGLFIDHPFAAQAVDNKIFDKIKYFTESQFKTAIQFADFTTNSMKKCLAVVNRELHVDNREHITTIMKTMKTHTREFRRLNDLPLYFVQQDYANSSYPFAPQIGMNYPLRHKFTNSKGLHYFVMFGPNDEMFKKTQKTLNKVRTEVMRRILCINSITANESRRGVEFDDDWIDDDVVICWRGIYLRFG